MKQTTIAQLQAKALQYLELQTRLTALKHEIIGKIGDQHTCQIEDVCLKTRTIDIIDNEKLGRDYPQAYQNCTVATATILEVNRGGRHG